MRASNLPSTRGYISTGAQLRTQLAKAISQLETYAKRASVLPPGVASLQTFLDAGDTALTAIKALPASIAITGTLTLSAGSPTSQLTVTKTPLSGSTSDVTAAAAGTTYTSSNTAVFTVSTAGLMTRVAAGSATVTAQNGNKTDTKTITVS